MLYWEITLALDAEPIPWPRVVNDRAPEVNSVRYSGTEWWSGGVVEWCKPRSAWVAKRKRKRLIVNKL